MTFRYHRFRIFVNSLIFLLICWLSFSWRGGSFHPEVHLWHLLGLLLLPVVIYFTCGTHILDKYKVDTAGLTVKRPFQKRLAIPFARIKTLRLHKETENLDAMAGDFEICYQPEDVYTVPLQQLRTAELFVAKMREGLKAFSDRDTNSAVA